MGDGKRSTSPTKHEAAGKSHRAKRCNTANEVQKLVLGGLFYSPAERLSAGQTSK